MPGMSGLDVLARLSDEGLQPRVVVMTSDDTPETLLQRAQGSSAPLHAQADRPHRADRDGRAGAFDGRGPRDRSRLGADRTGSS